VIKRCTLREAVLDGCRVSSARRAVLAVACLFALATARPLAGYSVLSHEAIIDTVWDPVLKPLLLDRYPTASPAQVREAHAYAYGGCVIQDMGYYPFGNKLFSDLTHYVRTGDFIEALLRQATEDQNMYEYAFALGALSHYAADNQGHPLAVNLSVPEVFPKLRRKFGGIVTYEDDPTAHIMVEFSFDVAQIAGSGYTPATYGDFIGFKVSKPVLERAFQETYGLDFKGLFLSEDLAIGTYRRSASEIIPQMTKVAWKRKRAEILKQNPNITQHEFVYRLSRRDYQSQWGRTYRKPRFNRKVWGASEQNPGLLARFLVFLALILPRIGPLRTLNFKPPTPQTEDLFTQSFTSTTEHYRLLLTEAAADVPQLANTDLDTGQPTRAGAYTLADQTYAKLLDSLAERHFSGVTAALRNNILDFYSDLNAPIATKKDPKEWRKVVAELQDLKTGPGQERTAQPAASR
jgi:Zinc dependent phospholipase C